MIPRGQWLRIMTRDNWTCQRCGRSLEEEGARPQVGHIVAASMGGRATDSNLRAECGDCNESAGNGLARVGDVSPQYSTVSENPVRNLSKEVRRAAGVFFSLKDSRKAFQDTYCAYPVHIAEDAAERAWRNAVVRLHLEKQISFGEAAEEILAAVRRYALSDSARPDGIRKGWRPPYMATWLNAGQFKDRPEDWQANDKRVDERTRGIAAKVARADRKENAPLPRLPIRRKS